MGASQTLPGRRSGSFADIAQEEEWELRKHRPGGGVGASQTPPRRSTPSQLPDGKLASPSAHLPSIGEGTSQGPTHTFPNAGREARKRTPSKFLVLSRILGR